MALKAPRPGTLLRYARLGLCLWLALAPAALFAFQEKSEISDSDKIAIIRSLVADFGIARKRLPSGKQGIEVSPDGKVLNPDSVRQQLIDDPESSGVGDRVAITSVDFKDDHIVFLVNGGPPKHHWYNHVQIGAGVPQSATVDQPTNGPHGAQITLQFGEKLGHLTPEEVRHDLTTLIDWDPPATAEVMVKSIPPPAKQAIENHHVLVGMTTDMVIAAVGRTDNKNREADAQGNPYEDWIYGGPPPKDTIFIRIVNNRVTEIDTYKANGEKVVENTPDPSLKDLPDEHAAANADAASSSASAPASQQAPPPGNDAPPTLRRPGEVSPFPPSNAPPGGQPPATKSGCCSMLL